MVTVNNLAITFGQFISYLIDSAFVNVHEGWRWMLGIAAIPAIIQLFAILLIGVESPRWLMSVKKSQEAKDVLIKVRGTDDISAELHVIF